MDLIEFLYRVMEELSNAGVPIVFKGAMVLILQSRTIIHQKLKEQLEI